MGFTQGKSFLYAVCCGIMVDGETTKCQVLGKTGKSKRLAILTALSLRAVVSANNVRALFVADMS